MSWDNVLFDLDGTLTDSGTGVANGVLHALRSLGYPDPDERTLQKYLGPPLWVSFADYAGIGPDQMDEAVRLYRDYYNEIGKYENAVFDGIEDLLRDLNNAGKRVAVATSKVEYAAVSILEHFNIDHWFEVIAGADEDGSRRGTKTLVIESALERLSLCDGASIVMIGDREHDIHGGQNHNLPTIGVQWGYAEAGELETAKADHIVADVAGLRALLLG